MKNKKWNIILGASSGIILILFICLTSGWDVLLKQMSTLDSRWIIGAGVAMLLYWIMESKILQIITQSMGYKQKFKSSFKITMVGQFFNAVTPFASGGQPAQLYLLTKEGVGVGKASSILMIKFIVYQAILTVYSIVLIVWKAEFFSSRLSNVFYLTTVGFVVNTCVILLLVLFSKYKEFTLYLFDKISIILYKIKIIKDVDKAKVSINEQLENFHTNMKLAFKNKKVLIKSMVLTAIQLTVFYIIPYFVYRSFGYNKAGVVDMIAANSFVSMITSFVPLPGAIGGAEGSFYLFFNIFFDKSNILIGVLLWRIVTFYSCIAVGGIFMSMGNTKNKVAIE